ncbi:MAG: nucleoside/nucleotide kinase family protein [Desulfobaccales bacterium]
MEMNPVPQFLNELFRRLEHNKITYGVLKHFDQLPDRPSRDVDIWVMKDHFQEYIRIMFGVAQAQGWQFLARFLLPGYLNAGGYFFIKNHGENHICELDALPFFHWRGISYLDESILPKHIRTHKNGFKVVSPGIEAAAMIFRGGMMGVIKETDREKIVECLNDDPYSFLEALQRPFGRQCAEMIMEAALARKWDFLEQNMRSFRRTIVKRALLSHPASQMRQWLKYLGGKVKAHLHPSHGFFLVLVGPDGVGKSTIAKLLIESEFAKKAFLDRVFYYRRFQIPWLKKIVQRGKQLDVAMFATEINNDGMVDQLPPLKAAIYSMFLALEYFLGHYYVQRLKPNGGLMVFDRYFYDYLVFQDFLCCPRWLLKFLAQIVPRPDATIYLENDARTIHSRKLEWPLEEIERQVCSYGNLATLWPNSYTIATSKEVTKITDDIIDIITKILIKKSNIGNSLMLSPSHSTEEI